MTPCWLDIKCHIVLKKIDIICQQRKWGKVYNTNYTCEHNSIGKKNNLVGRSKTL